MIRLEGKCLLLKLLISLIHKLFPVYRSFSVSGLNLNQDRSRSEQDVRSCLTSPPTRSGGLVTS